ncbi:MAG: hypothetical protein JO107_03605, partial [Hyphomicrobiales bacterium]|nr:hypothetical protein [Hyphomicrobiales bacterium]MBV8662168.1 hypothetical protein [Hyphomicrobiales bacterium]
MTARHAAPPRKPWYLVIGSPGSGKSSLLANSGLSFQHPSAIAPDIAAATGDLARYWEADDAVFVECAGRLVGAACSSADEAAWEGLLSLLKRRRSPPTLNGAIVVAALDALTGAPANELEATMRHARKRIAQANAVLRAQLPVYLVVTKVDRLPGFASFFGASSQAEHDQVWGVTLPLGDGRSQVPGVAEGLAQAIGDLRGALSRGLLAHLHDEDDPRRAAEIFAFPKQFGSMTERLRAPIEALGGESRREPAPRLRGLYLTAAAPGFFLKRLFADVIPAEEAVVTIDARDTPAR